MTSEIAGGTWDITQLEALEQDATGTWVPAQIVDRGENFRFRATFDGSGAVWNNLENQGHVAVAEFYAERMGAEPFWGTFERDIAVVNVTLGAGGPYLAVTGDLTLNRDGIYRCGVTLTFEDANGVADLGILGFRDDCLIQVSQFES